MYSKTTQRERESTTMTTTRKKSTSTQREMWDAVLNMCCIFVCPAPRLWFTFTYKKKIQPR